MQRSKFRFVDLFAGLGGFHVALKALGGKCVFAAEWKEHLRDLYNVNFGIRPAGDITKIDPDDVPDHDLPSTGADSPVSRFQKQEINGDLNVPEQGHLFFNVTLLRSSGISSPNTSSWKTSPIS